MDPLYSETYSLDYTFLSFKRAFQLVVGFIITFLFWVNLSGFVGMANGAGTNGPYGLAISLVGGAVLFSTWNRSPPAFTQKPTLNMVLESAIRLSLFFVGVVAFYWAWVLATSVSDVSPQGFEGNMLLILVPCIGAILLVRGWRRASTYLL
ncbi:hypothetical protein [Haladaptatus sp. CMSO5]|uniref:hypothetical protein n=1 Tax=Haladaptatus sp. CMSO5 TaxID=3120514 RepID=UPI002FCE5FA7